jgi:SHS2 domain-containing protein
MPVELIDHTGDVGIVVRSPSLETLYAEVAGALFSILADAPEPKPAERRTFAVSPDPDSLRDFLSDLLYRFSVDHEMYVAFTPGTGTVDGAWEPYDPARHPLRTELKAVTWHQLELAREREGWRARVIFDV